MFKYEADMGALRLIRGMQAMAVLMEVASRVAYAQRLSPSGTFQCLPRDPLNISTLVDPPTPEEKVHGTLEILGLF
jgi:hypothetical protein